MIHPLTDCQAPIPESTNVWQFCVVLPNVQIGENCNICSHCMIENDVNVDLYSVGRQKIGDGDHCRFYTKVNCKNQNRVPYLENRVRNNFP